MLAKLNSLLCLLLLNGACVSVNVQELTASTDKNNGPPYQAQTRKYYVAAEHVEWDYAPLGLDPLENKPVPVPWGSKTKYQKVRYIEYTDDTFKSKKEQPQWLGILGPIIRAVEGDKIEVTFLNRTKTHHISMHPHGVVYDKDNEGAMYSGIVGKGAMIMPGERYTYHWLASEKSAPGPLEGGSKVWLYHSHNSGDIYLGLMGPIIITSAKYAKEDGLPNDVDKEFVNLYLVFNESIPNMSPIDAEGHLKHAINGYIFGNLTGLKMKVGEKVRWHLLALGTEVDLHSAHWHGEVVKYQGSYTDVIELLPASMKTVDMRADNAGKWMLHCHVDDHRKAGMYTTYEVVP
ncbi:MAG: multicopper oxidase domain-containing protein [Pseudomonadota bacterium]|nr:multicopper oxidase domain-containing protein [Pseudomonadota bacterium]